MSTSGWLQLRLYVAVLVLLAKPLGQLHGCGLRGAAPCARSESEERSKRLIYRGAGVDPAREMSWDRVRARECSGSISSARLVVYGLQRLRTWCRSTRQAWRREPGFGVQHRDELRHEHELAGLRRAKAAMSYLTQMLALAVQNFVSAATGMAVLVALIRGFARKEASGIGNFWTDLVAPPSTSCCRCRSSSPSRW
jgi:K+-transporting ATPase ATPase A chain